MENAAEQKGTNRPNKMWQVDRNELLKAAEYMIVIQGNTTIEEAAKLMARLHYKGKSKGHAAGKFMAALMPIVARRQYEELVERLREINAKSESLQNRDWRFIQSENGNGGGHWRHPQFGSINKLGASFATFEEATEVAYKHYGNRE